MSKELTDLAKIIFEEAQQRGWLDTPNGGSILQELSKHGHFLVYERELDMGVDLDRAVEIKRRYNKTRKKMHGKRA